MHLILLIDERSSPYNRKSRRMSSESLSGFIIHSLFSRQVDFEEGSWILFPVRKSGETYVLIWYYFKGDEKPNHRQHHKGLLRLCHCWWRRRSCWCKCHFLNRRWSNSRCSQIFGLQSMDAVTTQSNTRRHKNIERKCSWSAKTKIADRPIAKAMW